MSGPRADARISRLRRRCARRVGEPQRGRIREEDAGAWMRRRPPARGFREDRRPEESCRVYGRGNRRGPVGRLAGQQANKRYNFYVMVTAFDKELAPGARNAIRVCLNVQPHERVTVIADRECEDIAASLVHEIEEVGAPYKAFILEEVAQRPLVDLPKAIADDMEQSQVSILAVHVQRNELGSRMQLTDIVNRRKMRHGHMVNINRQMMLEGMRADFLKVDRLSSKVIDIVRNAKEVRATTKGGSAFTATLNPNYKWLKTSGLISPDKWGNLPGGEVFTTPGNVEGTLVIDGVVGDFLCEKYHS